MRKQPSSIDRQVGRCARALRIEAGVVEYEAASVIGVSLAAYRELEDGASRFQAVQLIQLAQKFRVSASAFFDYIDAANIISADIIVAQSAAPVLH